MRVPLPDDLWICILERLDFRSRLTCERVSRQLYKLLNQRGLWRDMQLSLEELNGSDNDFTFSELVSPAARQETAFVSVSDKAT